MEDATKMALRNNIFVERSKNTPSWTCARNSTYPQQLRDSSILDVGGKQSSHRKNLQGQVWMGN